jgi:CRP-like cAMP-binding protein
MVNGFHKSKLAKGSFLFQEDEKANEIFLIRKGDVQILKLAP